MDLAAFSDIWETLGTSWAYRLCVLSALILRMPYELGKGCLRDAFLSRYTKKYVQNSISQYLSRSIDIRVTSFEFLRYRETVEYLIVYKEVIKMIGTCSEREEHDRFHNEKVRYEFVII